MNSNTGKIFAALCESLLSEASSTLSLITGIPGGSEVIKALHKEMGLSHDQEYMPISKISWGDLKDTHRGSWVIIQGDRGTGAIKSSGGNTGDYKAYASSGGEPKYKSDGRGGNILDFLKDEIGNLRKFYVGRESGKVNDLQKQRRQLKTGSVANDSSVTADSLVNKFRPLWIRAITAAVADIKGHVANQIKNDAFGKARMKLEQVQTLQDILDDLRSESQDTPPAVKQAVQMGIYMAASHYYPEETGRIVKNYGRNYSPQKDEGTQQLLKDISDGDTAKIGTVLSFFKRSLISG